MYIKKIHIHTRDTQRWSFLSLCTVRQPLLYTEVLRTPNTRSGYCTLYVYGVCTEDQYYSADSAGIQNSEQGRTAYY